MTRFAQGNGFLLLSMICAAASQIVLKSVLRELPEDEGWRAWRELIAPARFWRVALAGTLVVTGFGGWVMALARLELSYAYPIACASIIFVPILSTIFLGESVTPRNVGRDDVDPDRRGPLDASRIARRV